ncbi:MAG TPA: amino acid permease C-terminal domain-containing protein, partial [Candidatus Melainabacteria bacterium]|nr:amino acid permease C-terminal domain-containing protein [Candidatus Melainabacteria bacterium]
ILLVGLAIFLFTISFNLEDMAHFANTVVLLVLIIVNAALIVHRKKYPDMKRPFKVPLVPFVPILGIIANLYLLYQIIYHPYPLFMALGALLLGLVGFLAWHGLQPDELVLPGYK